MFTALLIWVSDRIDRVRSKPWRGLSGPYFDKALAAAGVAFLCCMLGLTSNISTGWFGRQVPVPAHFLVDGSRLTAIPVLATPSLSLNKVERWSEGAVQDIFTMNFFNADDHVAGTQQYFTDLGWSAFQNALASTKILNDLKSRQLEMTVGPLKRARVVKRLSYGNVPVWEVQIPMFVAYTGATRPVYQRVMCSLVVRAVPTTTSVEGLAIAKISLRTYG